MVLSHTQGTYDNFKDLLGEISLTQFRENLCFFIRKKANPIPCNHFPIFLEEKKKKRKRLTLMC